MVHLAYVVLLEAQIASHVVADYTIWFQRNFMIVIIVPVCLDLSKIVISDKSLHTGSMDQL